MNYSRCLFRRGSVKVFRVYVDGAEPDRYDVVDPQGWIASFCDFRMAKRCAARFASLGLEA